jgi:hypothetical protein
MIDNTLHPRWNQFLRLQIFSLDQESLRIDLFDHDKLSDDVMGVTTTTTKPMIPLFGSSDENPPHIHLRYQVTHPGQVPFVDDPFIPLIVHLQIQSIENVANKDLFVAARLDTDVRPKCSATPNNGIWNELMQFSVLEPSAVPFAN